MPKQSFLSRISHQVLVADGATGTNLIARGLPSGKTAENWVLENPNEILRLHRDFILAGAQIILTSTFGASSIRLQGTSMEAQAVQVNQQAVRLAQQAAGGTDVYIAGSLGPVGGLLKPYGTLIAEDIQKAYAEQAEAITGAGADLLVIETQFDLGEIKAAIAGARTASDLPLVVSLSYDRGTRTMMGVSPSQAASELNNLPVDVIGINCGRSLEENLKNLKELRQTTPKPIWFKPNAGLPRVDSAGTTLYDTTPSMMADQVQQWLDAGAQVIGGCCGTSPEHLKAINAQVS